jgi:hypothetical protein
MSVVLLNGVCGIQFHCKREVIQEDPLSPLIYVLTDDLLQPAINKAFRDGIIQAHFSSDFGVWITLLFNMLMTLLL